MPLFIVGLIEKLIAFDCYGYIPGTRKKRNQEGELIQSPGSRIYSSNNKLGYGLSE